MTKINALRRFFLPCLSASPAASSSTATTAKKRLSTSLRDDIVDSKPEPEPETSPDQDPTPLAPPRSSRTMIIGTIFGHRRGSHVWFCVQPDRLTTRPVLLLQIPLSTQLLVKEMQCGSVRVALETRPGSGSLRSVPTWAACCNGRKLGFAVRKKPTEAHLAMLTSLRSITVGAGVIPGGLGTGSGRDESEGEGELIYMRANYECIVGGPDSESFHLISPDQCQCPGQEFCIFLLRSR